MKKNMEQLYLEHEKMLYKIAYKYKNIGQIYGYDLDDLISIQHIAFMKAAKNYDESKGVKFITYLTIAAEREIQTEFNMIKDTEKRKANMSTLSINTTVQMEDNEKEIQLKELTIENPYEEIEFRDFIEKTVDMISVKSDTKTIVEMRINGYSFGEIGKVLNINEKAASARYNRAIKRLKKHLSIEQFM